MNDCSSGKIQNAHLFQPSALPPDPVTKRIVNQCCPEQAEHQEALEFYSLHKSPCNQRRRNDGKHHLESGEKLMRNGSRISGVRFGADALKADVIQSADQSADIRAERKRISEKHPLHADQRHKDIT